jgi:oxygen-dependent protoporphyrinogen oxidase
VKDAVIIGAGLAGLSAAWRLRQWDIQVLEANQRVGGRIQSEKRGPYVLNWGGHMFAGEGGSTAELLAETGTRSIRIPGSLKGMAMNGKFIATGPIQTYPFRIPMRFSSRLAVLASGTKVGRDVLRYTRAVKTRSGETGEVRQQRIYDFDNDRTFAEYIGELPDDARSFFLPPVTPKSPKALTSVCDERPR